MKTETKKIPRFLSVAGLCYILGACLFLASGIIRGELISTICGTALLSFALFSFFHVFFSFLFWKTATFSVSWTSEQSIAISICKEKPLTPLHFLFSSEVLCTVSYATSLGEQQRRHVFYLLPITETQSIHLLSLPPRGYYHNDFSSFRIRDYSHFFTFSITQPTAVLLSPLVVYPIPESPDKTKISQKPFGITRGKSTFKRSEDLYETRSYAPGDDPRKINWKVYAHTGDLSIRQGELLPPPADEYIFIVNSSVSFIPHNEHTIWFDILINRITFVALYLMGKNKTITFFISNENGTFEKMSISNHVLDAKEKLLSFLTIPQLTSIEIPLTPILSSLPKNASLFLCTLPFYSFNIAILKSYSPNLMVFLGPVLEELTPVSFRSSLQSLVFMQKTNTVFFSSEELNKTLLHEMQKFKKEGFNVSKM